MRFAWALNEALHRFNVSITDLAERSGVNRTQISKFVNGHSSMTVRNLEPLIEALPSEARDYFFQLAQGKKLVISANEKPGEYQVEVK